MKSKTPKFKGLVKRHLKDACEESLKELLKEAIDSGFDALYYEFQKEIIDAVEVMIWDYDDSDEGICLHISDSSSGNSRLFSLTFEKIVSDLTRKTGMHSKEQLEKIALELEKASKAIFEASKTRQSVYEK